MQSILKVLFDGGTLSKAEAASAMDSLMEGKAVPEQVGAFLGVLRGRGETVDEIAGCAASMRRHALKLPIKRQDLCDTCGTGGDGANTFNISTVCAFVLAAAGVGVVKHGNRSVSSRCGSADVLEALGVAIDLAPEAVARGVDAIGFGFLFARTLHPAMKNVAAIRQNLGVRTVFNLLGPLTNPAGARRQVIGVYDRKWLVPMAEVLRELGSEEVMLVHGGDGLDEITLDGLTYVAHLRHGAVKSYEIVPEDAGLKACGLGALKGGDAATNARIALAVLKGEPGPRRDIVLLNSAAALMVCGRVANLKDGAKLAAELIDEGAALQVLERLKGFKG